MNDVVANIPKVCVMLSTYNGEKFLREQLNSIIAQNVVEIHLVVRDDGSSDNTTKILKEYDTKYHFDKLIIEENKGWRYSFSKLVLEATECEYYAFADQDDVWNINKLIVAITQLSQADTNKPLLYESCFNVINKRNEILDYKCVKRSIIKNNTFFKDLHEYKIGDARKGCLQVFNSELMLLLRNTVKCCDNIFPEHDKLVEEIALLFGAIIYDSKTITISHRIHNSNETYVFSIKMNVFKDFLSKFIRKFMQHIKSHYYSNNLIVLNYFLYDKIDNDEIRKFIRCGVLYRKDKKSKKSLLKNSLWKELPLYWRLAHKFLIMKGWY